MGVLDRADDVILMRYNELRAFIGNPTGIDGRAIAAAARAKREAAYRIKPRDWVGTCTQTQLDFPYLGLWGFPEKFHRGQGVNTGELTGVAGSPGTVEGIARVVLSEGEFDLVQPGDILVCEMTNPAWQVLFPKISGLVTNAGGFAAHPAVLAREYEIPAVVGTSVATDRIRTGDRIRISQRTVMTEAGTERTEGLVEILETAPAPAAGID
jgi:pyruvate,water dikinase